VLNAWGCWLWSQRGKLTAYFGSQSLLAGISVVFAALTLAAHVRGQGSAFPLWSLVLGPALMIRFDLLEHFAKRSQQRSIAT
jgi:hypothetical protein